MKRMQPSTAMRTTQNQRHPIRHQKMGQQAHHAPRPPSYYKASLRDLPYDIDLVGHLRIRRGQYQYHLWNRQTRHLLGLCRNHLYFQRCHHRLKTLSNCLRHLLPAMEECLKMTLHPCQGSPLNQLLRISFNPLLYHQSTLRHQFGP
jgi:hypothetical protein